MIKKRILLIILIIFILNYGFSIQPDRENVKKVVENEINKEIKKNKREQLITAFFENIFNKIRLKNLSKNFWTNLFIFLVIFIAVAGILLLLFFILRNASSKQYAEKRLDTLRKEHKDHIFDENDFKKYVNERKYSEAIIYLHRSTIFYLLSNKVIYNKNMTNYSLYNRIKDNNLKSAFKTIFIYSEKILFDEYTANEKDFLICKDNYYKNFIKTRA